MKRHLSVGEGYARKPLNFKPLPHPTCSLKNTSLKQKIGWLVTPISWAKVTGLSSLVAFFFFCLSVGSVSAQDSIQPLQIGDKLPDYLWDIPLQVVNHPEGKESMTLDNFRGKPIILDFMSTGCSSCIKAIPIMESEIDHVSEEVYILPVTNQKREQVADFILQNEIVKGTQLPIIVDDVMLKKHFPHLYISHLVWISSDGKVRATTGTNHLVQRTLNEFLSGAPLDWPVKTEATPFFNAPLIDFYPESGHLKNNSIRSLLYTVLTGYTEGVGPFLPNKQDSLAGISRTSYRNRQIIDLYRIALGDKFPGLNNVIWKVSDPSKISIWESALTSQTRDEWYRENSLCYERTHSIDMERTDKQKLMFKDLNDFLPYVAILENHNGENYLIISNK